jgi:hypothetical protein
MNITSKVLITIITLVALFTCSAVIAEDALSVRAMGTQPSLIFTDAKKVKVNIQVRGGSGDVGVSYVVSDTFGVWQKKGVVNIQRTGSDPAERPLLLAVPGRGHYSFVLNARCGNQTAEQKTSVAVIYAPAASDIDSPWGIFWIPNVPPGSNEEDSATQLAENMRLMGASWVRFNFWESVYGSEVRDGKVVLDLKKMKKQAAAFQKAGLHIFGEIVMVPRVLASSADETGSGDAGPLFSRIKPKDYVLWDQLVEQITREFKDDIDVWEIWNEPDIPMAYWSGTADEFVELVQHTSAAIRRGNPKAKVAGAGFTSAALTNPEFKARTERMFELGIGKYFDILSMHYSDGEIGVFEKWDKFLKKHNLSLPLLNSEEISAIPLENLKHGIRTFKFIHIDIGYPSLAPLLNLDWSPSPSAVAYSTGAHIIGSKKFVRAEERNGFIIYYFGTKDPVAAIRQKAATTKPKKLSDLSEAYRNISVTVKSSSKAVVEYVDIFGRGKKLVNGKGIVPFQPVAGRTGEYRKAAVKDPCVFITNCSQITSIKGIAAAKKRFDVVAEAEDGEYSKGWSIAETDGWSGSKYINIWAADPPDDKGYYVNLKMNVPESGEYVVFFSGNSLARLAPPASLSPFIWRFDSGEEYKADNALPVIQSNGAPEGLSTLGRVKLTAGQHIFHLRLLAPRTMYDNNYALWFDAIALMRAK